MELDGVDRDDEAAQLWRDVGGRSVVGVDGGWYGERGWHGWFHPTRWCGAPRRRPPAVSPVHGALGSPMRIYWCQCQGVGLRVGRLRHGRPGAVEAGSRSETGRNATRATGFAAAILATRSTSTAASPRQRRAASKDVRKKTNEAGGHRRGAGDIVPRVVCQLGCHRDEAASRQVPSLTPHSKPIPTTASAASARKATSGP